MTTAIRELLPDQAAYPLRLVALGWKSTLRVRGTLHDTADRSIAIVGARAASQTAMDRAHALGKHLAAAGVHVVSGGALGIDGAAHRGCLDGGGTTTVVLGSGVDVLYPARHADLFHQIVVRGGALVSLLPAGSPPLPGTFVQRNPLIAALADAVVVVEADVRSGSMSTAAAARKQGRLVAAWPGSRGCDRLIANGAAIVENGADALAVLDGKPRYPVAPVELDGDAAKVRDALLAGARGIDEIVRQTGLPVRAVLRALPQLELCPARMQ